MNIHMKALVGLALVLLLVLVAGCGGGGGTKSTAWGKDTAGIIVAGWEHCATVGDCTTGDPVEAAQHNADEIVNASNLSTADKKKYLGQMLDFADANFPDAASSIQRRIDSLG
jgi:hypothetical protein